MNIAEILQKYARKDEVFYSTCFGEVLFIEIVNSMDCTFIKTSTKEGGAIRDFFVDGKYNTHGECVLFPSKDQRDWQKWAEEQEQKLKDAAALKFGDYVTFDDGWGRIIKFNENEEALVNSYADENIPMWRNIEELTKLDHFDPKLLKPFDRVLVRDDKKYLWKCTLFSHFVGAEISFPYSCIGSVNEYCIPYNTETAHLVNTADEAPEFYR